MIAETKTTQHSKHARVQAAPEAQGLRPEQAHGAQGQRRVHREPKGRQACSRRPKGPQQSLRRWRPRQVDAVEVQEDGPQNNVGRPEAAGDGLPERGVWQMAGHQERHRNDGRRRRTLRVHHCQREQGSRAAQGDQPREQGRRLQSQRQDERQQRAHRPGSGRRTWQVLHLRRRHCEGKRRHVRRELQVDAPTKGIITLIFPCPHIYIGATTNFVC